MYITIFVIGFNLIHIMFGSMNINSRINSKIVVDDVKDAVNFLKNDVYILINSL